MPISNSRAADVRAAMRDCEEFAQGAGVYASSRKSPEDMPTVAQRRRRRRAGLNDPLGVATLMLNDDGILFWHLGDVDGTRPERHRLRRGVPAAPEGEIIELYHYEKLEPNKVNALLRDKDNDLNKQQGLRRLTLRNAGTPAQSVDSVAATAPAGKKKRLLFVHGTFSECAAFFAGMALAPNGRASLATLFGRYDEVLGFEHPTLSVSPVMNAFDLARLLARADGPLDIIAHSRGGLVTRWLLEGYGLNGAGPYRAALVGSPLNGTSLASPPRLKGALNVLSNIGTALKLGGAAAVVYMPFLAVPLALVRIASSVITVAAKTPLVDAAVSMIPGLQGQSRIADHPELMRLRAVKLAQPPEYFVVKSNFETEDPGWQFWKWFRKDQLLNTGADLIFPGANDLVVDTESMSDIPNVPLPDTHIKDFRTNDRVHHTNYFAQQETLDFLLASLT